MYRNDASAAHEEVQHASIQFSDMTQLKQIVPDGL